MNLKTAPSLQVNTYNTLTSEHFIHVPCYGNYETKTLIFFPIVHLLLVLNIASPYERVVNLTSMSYHDNSGGDFPLEPEVSEYGPHLLVMGPGVVNLDAKGGHDEYVQYVLKHNQTYASEWTRVGLIHPGKFFFPGERRRRSHKILSGRVCSFPLRVPNCFVTLSNTSC